jgi:hypothetical protein
VLAVVQIGYGNQEHGVLQTLRALGPVPGYRQRSHTQISAAKGIKARVYLSLNGVLEVLCRKTFMPTKPPSQPPSAPHRIRVRSDTRRPEQLARHLSKPNMRNAKPFSARNRVATIMSGVIG